MTEDILVNVTPQEARVALVQQGAVQELHLEREATRGLAGNVYLGKVSRVLPGMQSAFIDIGLDRAAFLHVADLWQSRAGAHPLPIEKVLSRASRCWCRSSRTRSAPRARGCRRRSASPAACSCTCRRIRTSACRSASRTRPSVPSCARGSSG